MRTHQNEDRARQAVAAKLAGRQQNPMALARAASIDLGTLVDFLEGRRWPRMPTQGKIEQSLGWPAGTINAIANGGDVPRDEQPADDEDMEGLIEELRSATPERRRLLRDLLASWRQTG